MTEIRKQKYRWVVNFNGTPYYYTGELQSETKDFYIINDVRNGLVEISKDKVIVRRPLEEE